MKNKLIWEVLLICILGFTGWYLHTKVEHLKSTSSKLKTIEAYKRKVLSYGIDGIDVFGAKIESGYTNNNDGNEKGIAAFLLRNDTLDADLRFWNEVNSYFTDHDAVRLVSYCENERCVETIRKNPNVAHFSVLEYGLVGDMQAIIGADESGECWVQSNKSDENVSLLTRITGFTKITWRDGNVTPFDIAIRMGL